MSVIECNNVGIRYITGDFKAIGLKEYVIRKLKHDYHVKEFWADKDVTFKLEKGDMLGIIGSNGAGKSTLLKAITGIMIPTYGTLETNGTIAALLELGSGFDGDMTVRENTYLRGALLGYTRAFLDSKYDEIIHFAELDEFQDYEFKQLSSGMKSRLAFSIACLVNPDIIILDEVLSVGDGSFRKKSGDKMKEILDSGVTGLLVSHTISQVRELCNKVLWLDHGKQIAFIDEVELYCDAYEEFLMTKKLPKDRSQIEKLAADYIKREEEDPNLRRSY
jgi:ABC-2 type transport system ATP-binding protein